MSSNSILLAQRPSIFVPGKSVLFDGADHIRLAYDSRIGDFGNGEWTMEGFIKFLAAPTDDEAIMAFGNGGGSQSPYLRLCYSPSGNCFYADEANSVVGLWSAVGNTIGPIDYNHFYHVVAERYNGQITLYVDGNFDTTKGAYRNSYGGWNSASSVHQSGMQLVAGSLVYGSRGFIETANALLSNLRVTKGRAVYKGNFTPPTSKLEAGEGTTVLLCNSDTLVDASPYNWPLILDNSTPTISDVSPFVSN
jgi:hypothetical protein